MMCKGLALVSLLAAVGAANVCSAEVIARFRGDYQDATPAAGWQYAWNSGPLDEVSGYQPLVWNAKYKLYGGDATAVPAKAPAGYVSLGRWMGHPGRGASDTKDAFDRYVIAAYTVPADQTGIAWICDGSIVRPATAANAAGTVELRVLVNDTQKYSQVIQSGRIPSTVTVELGTLKKGDRVFVAVGPDGKDLNDGFELDYCISVLPPGEKPAAPEVMVHASADRPAMKGVAGRPDAGFVKAHESFLKRGQQGDVGALFLGDSITAGWSGGGKSVWDKSFAPLKSANFGIGGDMTQHVLWRIANGELDHIKPKVVVLMIGTNNTGSYTPEETIDGIGAVVKQVRTKLPESKVLLLGVFPRGEKPTDATRAKIKTINAAIAHLDDKENVRYLDIGAKFLQPDGTISKEIMPDFLHPTTKGYQIWADTMQPLLSEMLGNRH